MLAMIRVSCSADAGHTCQAYGSPASAVNYVQCDACRVQTRPIPREDTLKRRDAREVRIRRRPGE